MLTNEFSYNLPSALIAQKPCRPRDQARLLLLDKKTGQIQHKHFYDLPSLLRPGDVLVFNNSKVFKARLTGYKPTGGQVEIFLLRPLDNKTWEVLVKNKKTKAGLLIKFASGLAAKLISRKENIWTAAFNKSGGALQAVIDKIGSVPLPPYIKANAPLNDYQTVYAKERGSVAAPTAGLHFTKPLLAKLKKLGVQLEYLTLHVGLGTFQPIKTDKIENHRIHTEFATVDSGTARRLNTAKKQRRRIIAVGTTTVRTLESFAVGRHAPWRVPTKIRHGAHGINLYITPGYKFKFVDAMITNFHLPQSSLLVLVSALAGRDKIMAAYQTAIKKKYRFYSFGDAMLISSNL